ncbi:hypothetical protein EJ03DRAFT_5885 [Teratosphaeria nubilosa]|uniref:Uncharacterized protein n=1 Tax=Teratosphaeria nubilosa TaxID=161662 RepID=A0A6G1LNJ5_9PEZI|nr:hypothetical protein EJ03DRAFT_5885 [Teratosphaeria nubilosa]
MMDLLRICMSIPSPGYPTTPFPNSQLSTPGRHPPQSPSSTKTNPDTNNETHRSPPATPNNSGTSYDIDPATHQSKSKKVQQNPFIPLMPLLFVTTLPPRSKKGQGKRKIEYVHAERKPQDIDREMGPGSCRCPAQPKGPARNATLASSPDSPQRTCRSWLSRPGRGQESSCWMA